jgi:hypothetical protein
MISIARTTNRNVTHWKDGEMVLRWTAAGMINGHSAASRAASRCPNSSPRCTDTPVPRQEPGS